MNIQLPTFNSSATEPFSSERPQVTIGRSANIRRILRSLCALVLLSSSNGCTKESEVSVIDNSDILPNVENIESEHDIPSNVEGDEPKRVMLSREEAVAKYALSIPMPLTWALNSLEKNISEEQISRVQDSLMQKKDEGWTYQDLSQSCAKAGINLKEAEMEENVAEAFDGAFGRFHSATFRYAPVAHQNVFWSPPDAGRYDSPELGTDSWLRISPDDAGSHFHVVIQNPHSSIATIVLPQRSDDNLRKPKERVLDIAPELTRVDNDGMHFSIMTHGSNEGEGYTHVSVPSNHTLVCALRSDANNPETDSNAYVSTIVQRELTPNNRNFQKAWDPFNKMIHPQKSTASYVRNNWQTMSDEEVQAVKEALGIPHHYLVKVMPDPRESSLQNSIEGTIASERGGVSLPFQYFFKAGLLIFHKRTVGEGLNKGVYGLDERLLDVNRENVSEILQQYFKR